MWIRVGTHEVYRLSNEKKYQIDGVVGLDGEGIRRN